MKSRYVIASSAVALLALVCILSQSRIGNAGVWGEDSASKKITESKPVTTTNSKATKSEEEKKVAQMAILASNRMRDSGMLANKMGVSYALIGDTGEVTLSALEFAGIDPSRKHEVQGIVDDLWKDVSEHMRKNLVYENEKSNSDRGESVYTIAADRDFSDKRLFEFREQLKNAFGKTESEILYDGLGSTNHLGWFGRLDLTIRFTESGPSDTEARTVVEISGRDPKSGQAVSGGKFALDRDTLRSQLGSIFDDVIQW